MIKWIELTLPKYPGWYLSMLILWWCSPPALPRPPGCLRCLPGNIVNEGCNNETPQWSVINMFWISLSSCVKLFIDHVRINIYRYIFIRIIRYIRDWMMCWKLVTFSSYMCAVHLSRYIKWNWAQDKTQDKIHFINKISRYSHMTELV